MGAGPGTGAHVHRLAGVHPRRMRCERCSDSTVRGVPRVPLCSVQDQRERAGSPGTGTSPRSREENQAGPAPTSRSSERPHPSENGEKRLRCPSRRRRYLRRPLRSSPVPPCWAPWTAGRTRPSRWSAHLPVTARPCCWPTGRAGSRTPARGSTSTRTTTTRASYGVGVGRAVGVRRGGGVEPARPAGRAQDDGRSRLLHRPDRGAAQFPAPDLPHPGQRPPPAQRRGPARPGAPAAAPPEHAAARAVQPVRPRAADRAAACSKGGCARCGPSSWRFSPGETVDLAERCGLDLSQRQIAVLHERTAGWVAGIRLAAMPLRGHEDPDTFLAAFSGDEQPGRATTSRARS